MDPRKLRQAEDLFHRLADLPADQRGLALDEGCGGDTTLRSLVVQLLANDDGAMGEFLATPALDGSRPPIEPLDTMPVRVGRYTLLRRIGEGGMGTVYEATQDRPHRTVALKLIKPGHTSSQLLRRFQHEAEILGQLQHAGIACIHDAGMAEVEYPEGVTSTQPYFAMELIRGPSLTAYAANHGLDAKKRLGLFAAICDAVHHAHQKGVIHRDLKPANILVDASGQAKILDFGVARFTDSDVQSITLQGAAEQIIGTLQYMSPEQASGDRLALDTRSDIYSLGVILHELLTGELPLDLRDKTIPESARIIRDEEPTRLSAVNRDYRGDLETITAKALEKEKERRYQSASDLAADVRRFLNHEPITARPATTLYQFRKFARRNRGAVVASAAAIVILVAGVIATSTFAVGQYRARRESEDQREVAQAINDFLNNDLLGKANPYVGATHDARLRDVLDGAARSIESRFLGKPLVHASIRATLGRTYFDLGAYDEAARHLERAVTVYSGKLDPADPLLLDLRHALTLTHIERWKLDDADAVLERCFADLDAAHQRESEAAAHAFGDLGILRKRQGRYAESEQAYRRALHILAGSEARMERGFAITKQNLALVLNDQGKSVEAEALLREVVEVFKTRSGRDSADVAYALNNLGHVTLALGDGPAELDRAMDCFQQSYEIRARRLGPDHPESLRSRYSLGMVIEKRGEYVEAERIQREVLERRLATLEQDHIDVLHSKNYVARALERQERFAEAADIYRDVITRGRARNGVAAPNIQWFHENYLSLLRRQDDQEGIRAFFVDYLDRLEAASHGSEVDYRTLRTQAHVLLTCEIEALRQPEKALASVRRAMDMGGSGDLEVVETLALALEMTGNPAQATACLEQALRKLPPESSDKRRRWEERIGAMSREDGEVETP